ncbi:MAG: hypothetical protein IPM79_12890 [Polyangiaceae bacterium]|nr:hypothetical protein [Polyangiaceae bacterium]
MTLPAVVLAQPAATDAERLFHEAKAEVERGELATACPKLQLSWEQSGVIGALLSWADCEERRGNLVLARELWQRGATLVVDDPERVALVRSRVERLDAATAAAPTVSGPAHGVDRGKTEPLAAAPQPPVPRASPLPRSDEPSALILGGWISAGLGAAGAIAFAATGAAVLVTCEDETCPDDYQGVLVGNAVAGVAGGVGLALGAVLLGVGYGSRPAADVKLVPGPTELGLGLVVSF